MSRPLSPEPATATEPFWTDSSVGDLVIRSSDGVNFHVHKDVLSRASPFFLTMLSLPQSSSSSEPLVDGKPVVEAQEDSVVWAKLVPLTYIPSRAPLNNLPLIRLLLDAASKYDLVAVTDSLRHALLHPPLVKQNPLSIYALGCAYGLDDVARLAALHTLRTPIFFEYVDELQLISVRQYHRLCEYRKACGVAALRATSWSAISGSWLRRDDVHKSYLEVTCTSKTCKKVHRGAVYVRQAMATYVDKLERILEFTPDAEKACAPSLLEPVIKSAQGCSVCWGGIHEKVTAFSKLMQEELRRLIAEVQLDLS